MGSLTGIQWQKRISEVGEDLWGDWVLSVLHPHLVPSPELWVPYPGLPWTPPVMGIPLPECFITKLTLWIYASAHYYSAKSKFLSLHTEFERKTCKYMQREKIAQVLDLLSHQAVITAPRKVHKWYLKYLTMLLHDFKSFFHNFVDPYQILGPTSSRLANPGEKGFCWFRKLSSLSLLSDPTSAVRPDLEGDVPDFPTPQGELMIPSVLQNFWITQGWDWGI